MKDNISNLERMIFLAEYILTLCTKKLILFFFQVVDTYLTAWKTWALTACWENWSNDWGCSSTLMVAFAMRREWWSSWWIRYYRCNWDCAAWSILWMTVTFATAVWWERIHWGDWHWGASWWDNLFGTMVIAALSSRWIWDHLLNHMWMACLYNFFWPMVTIFRSTWWLVDWNDDCRCGWFNDFFWVWAVSAFGTTGRWVRNHLNGLWWSWTGFTMTTVAFRSTATAANCNWNDGWSTAAGLAWRRTVFRLAWFPTTNWNYNWDLSITWLIKEKWIQLIKKKIIDIWK